MTQADKNTFDVIVVGAGFSGLYLIHKMRQLGYSVKVFEKGDDVGGTWYWNRYPGARCDIESVDYSFGFDEDLQKEWVWSERYATQPEILRYIQHVADRFDLRPDIAFETRVEQAKWNEGDSNWTVKTDKGEAYTSRIFIMATGCLSEPKDIDIKGVEDFGGEIYRTHSWPHEGVDFTGKRVGLIGTGSSGIQTVPMVAEQAKHLTVFQRTACYAIPAQNGPIWPEKLEKIKNYTEYREEARWTIGGVPGHQGTEFALTQTEEQRRQRYEDLWSDGAMTQIGIAYADTLFNKESNDTLSDFAREKIRSKINDPKVADILTPTEFPICTKRLCLDTNYFETFNRDNAEVVSVKSDPIQSITKEGIKTQDRNFEFDAIIFATGFDAMTGALLAIDIQGRDGKTLKQKWKDGPASYLGLAVEGFPNFFTITGPGSPSVFSNMVVSIEQHVEWIADCMQYMDAHKLETIEATPKAQAAWVEYGVTTSQLTLFPLANSWYMGSNVPGKPRICLPYLGGVGAYRRVCNDVVAQDYLGFSFDGPNGARCNDGIVRKQQPDVVAVLEGMAEMNLPPFEVLTPQQAREMSMAIGAAGPNGPDVGEVKDGTLTGADGELEYRLYRPDTPGPHPVTVYFHGGGWVLGDHTSDDAFCRDLCGNANSIIVSVNYRHAPEHPFPAAADDGFAAVKWVASHAEKLGGIADQLAICGWSAGANVAAVSCQLARDEGGPNIKGQILITPVTDATDNSPSMDENAEGFILTKALMDWFINHYTDEADRTNPKVSPLLAKDLTKLPPGLVVTAEFDPLRDQGNAYAAALSKAGVSASAVTYPGQIHTSFTAVGMIPSANEAREKIATALKSFLKN